MIRGVLFDMDGVLADSDAGVSIFRLSADEISRINHYLSGFTIDTKI
ncbi:MAG: hypothetical protein MUF36_11980 [Bacteroidales bacterium]|jgi:phosphoglycolate phosphatase-like HAD superfamily hydrolase|nr:hypothetical protein [Bacteroidales bacterium]